MDRRTRIKVARSLLVAAQALDPNLSRLSADFASIPHFKNKWKRMTLDQVRKDPHLQEELFELLRTAYEPIGGHVKIRRPSDLVNGEITLFDVVDMDDDPEADAFIAIKKKPSGLKHVGMGHDGTRKAKNSILDHKAKDLRHRGVYAEVSDAIAHILLTRFDVPTVNNEEDVRKVLKGKKIEWVGAHPSGKYPNNPGWYYRDIAGHRHMKIIVGKPRV